MCGIAGMFGRDWSSAQLAAMVQSQAHRGPDAQGTWLAGCALAGLGHNRLSIIDLSPAGRQPMSDASGRYWITYNGEVYNYLELREELEGRYSFRTRTDTEAILAAYSVWGKECLDRLIGMFAFVIWDEKEQRVFGARDRFGVKPLHYHQTEEGGLWIASEIKALHAAGALREPNESTWASYLTSGMYDHTDDTFWNGISRIGPGVCFTWSMESGLALHQWYDVADAVLAAEPDNRDEQIVAEESLSLLEESVRLRFRADVQVGICVSGGLDSSLLLGLVHRIQGPESAVKTFTFYCGDPNYDEVPWVEQMLERTRHPSCLCQLTAEEVPELALAVQATQDEPFGGLPTLGMSKVHQRALGEDVTVLLDGNGLDEGWAGYEYYQRAAKVNSAQAPVQGSKDPSTRADCLAQDFAAIVRRPAQRQPFADSLLNLQYRDLRYAKIPRAMRFADRVSMMSSRELREPFLDHRIIELGLRQPADRKIRNSQGKYLLRQIARNILPRGVREAPKRAVQTPQREWLRGPLRDWATDCIEAALEGAAGEWFLPDRVRAEWESYCSGASDNSFYVWQWISAGMLVGKAESRKRKAELEVGS
jgi:asparagine synthase (glutamine-hydrolysing)